MRNILVLFLLLLSILGAYAQTMVGVYGTVTDFGGHPVANQSVHIRTDTTTGMPSFPHSATVSTNASGFYGDTVIVPAGFTTAILILETMDCQGFTHLNTVIYGGGTVLGNPADFQICAPVATGCQADFSYTTAAVAPGSAMQMATFTGFASGGVAPYTYFWSFGDGTSSTAMNPVHTYNSTGPFTACLTITDSTGCVSSHCAPIFFGVIINFCTTGFYSFADTASSPNGMVFVADSITASGTSVASWAWDFGDNTIGTGINASHVYAAHGVYVVTLTTTDNTGCTNTTTITIVVGNGVGGNCLADFQAIESGFGQVDCYNVSGAFHPLSMWDFGDGGTATTPYGATHTYAANGTYTICHTVLDPPTNCADTFCTTITVTTVGLGGGCAASFVAHPDTMHTYGMQFIGFFGNQSGINVASWSWSFGDGTSSTLQYPSHVYADSGYYHVCVTAADSSGCTATYCDSLAVGITIHVVNSQVTGTVFKGYNSTADHATVWLITFDPINYSLFAIDSVSLTPADNGHYAFHGVASNTLFTVKAALDSASADYSAYMPTYFGDSLFWASASWISTFGGLSPGNDIHLQPGLNNGGPGFISGSVFAGANKTGSGGLANVTVTLLDGAKQPVAHALSDVNGNFSFNDLAPDMYTVYVDMMNRTTFPATADLIANPFIETVLVEVNSTDIIITVSATGNDKALSMGSVGSLFPNPATEMANIQVSLLQAENLRLELLNALGQRVWVSESHLSAGIHVLPVNATEAAPGVYTLRILAEGKQAETRRLIKQ